MAFGMSGSRLSLIIGLTEMDSNPIVQKRWIAVNPFRGLIHGRGWSEPHWSAGTRCPLLLQSPYAHCPHCGSFQIVEQIAIGTENIYVAHPFATDAAETCHFSD
ncbi:hypothetical protein L195_g024644 [Trifolium pratense]|uniref:Transposase n=1 Tax=Trifolium pratense TaxID=57577 RepID=A0A2K3NE84_TRIPR|nr:hypothetical protein L195_g024644 [Trifolium pratense]